jgi:hypothetical protein
MKVEQGQPHLDRFQRIQWLDNADCPSPGGSDDRVINASRELLSG